MFFLLCAWYVHVIHMLFVCVRVLAELQWHADLLQLVVVR